MTLHKRYPLARLKALDGGEGRFEAIVAVFNNVDLVGDRIIPGAFKSSLARWETEGAPIPVIFDHDWGDAFAHVGIVTAAEETEKGLRVQGQLDVADNPLAAQVFKLMQRRSLKEFSFAYDVVRERTAKDGANDLLELDLVEVGPTLKGANPETELVGVKAAIEQMKSGRVLSKANENKIRQALSLMQDVLSAVEQQEEPKSQQPPPNPDEPPPAKDEASDLLLGFKAQIEALAGK